MSSAPSASSPVGPVTRWLILILASIGFAFDIYELLMLPLVGPDALSAMGYRRGSGGFVFWVSMLFYVPAVLGGVFGLLGGYLTDRLGRRRVLTWSIMLYAVSAFLSAYATHPAILLVFRCGVFVGVCVEFVAAVAWLAELFPDPRQREKALGLTQAFSSVGGLLVAIAYGICHEYGSHFFPVTIPNFLTAIPGIEQIPSEIGNNQQHAPWRYTLMSGLIPAVPLLIIRPFLPESPVWKQKQQAGTLKRPNVMELFRSPILRKTTIVTTIMFACSYGAAFGAIQQMRQIMPARAEVQAEAQPKFQKAVKALHDKGKMPTPADLKKLERKTVVSTAGKYTSAYTKVQEIGGLVGRFLLAFLILYIASRRTLIRMFQIPGLIVTPLVFFYFLQMPDQTFFTIDLTNIPVLKYIKTLPFTYVSAGIFLVALFTVGQFSFWGNYLPTVYPLHLRGTGESFAANVGGRMFGTSFAAVALGIAWALGFVMTGTIWEARMAISCAGIGLFVYALGFLTSFFLPEPKSGMLDEFNDEPEGGDQESGGGEPDQPIEPAT